MVRGAFNTDLGACLCDIGFSSSGAFGANCDVPSTCSTPATTDPLFVDSAVQSFVVDLAGSNLEVTTEVTMAENRRLNKLTVGTLPTCGYPVDHYVYNTVGGQCWDTVGVTVPVNSLEECGFLPTVNATHKSYTGYVNMQFAERFQTPRGFTIERLVSSQAEVEVTLPVLVQSSSVPLTVASAVSIEAVLTEFDYTSQPGFLRVRLSTNVQEPYQLTFKDMFVPNSLGFSVPQADACTETPCTQDVRSFWLACRVRRLTDAVGPLCSLSSSLISRAASAATLTATGTLCSRPRASRATTAPGRSRTAPSRPISMSALFAGPSPLSMA